MLIYDDTAGCDRNRIADLSKTSSVVQENYMLYDVTGFTQKWHSIPVNQPVATNCTSDIVMNIIIDRSRPPSPLRAGVCRTRCKEAHTEAVACVLHVADLLAHHARANRRDPYL